MRLYLDEEGREGRSENANSLISSPIWLVDDIEVCSVKERAEAIRTRCHKPWLGHSPSLRLGLSLLEEESWGISILGNASASPYPFISPISILLQSFSCVTNVDETRRGQV